MDPSSAVGHPRSEPRVKNANRGPMPPKTKRTSSPGPPVPTFAPPYPPSWVDRFTDWVDRLPIPWWSFYLVVALLLEVIQVTILWRGGVFDRYGVQFFQFFFPVNYVLAIFLMHAFDRRAQTALERFRPALRPGASPYSSLLYE